MRSGADFIVVGGGSSGCVLASRLSEDPDASVLLLEEGPKDSSPWIHIPVTFYKTSKGNLVKPYRWTPNAEHLGDPEPTMVQARVLGGGSSVNAMVYLRGQPRDYDEWRDAGAEGWGWNDVLPYYKRCESNDRFANDLHGTDGPLPVSDQQFTHPMSRRWVQACQQAGLRYNPDFNSGDQEGCGFYQINARGGRRGSTAVSYLGPARNRRNLVVKTGVRVLRIIFAGQRAIGVEALVSGRRTVLHAGGEVILTAGAINTPRLLLLSGLGNADKLTRLGIPLTQHLPGVGRNLQDHIEVSLIHEVNGPFSYDRYKKPHWQFLAGLEYLLFRRGPCTTNVVEGGAFFRSSLNDDRPDLQCCFMPGAGVEAGLDTVPGGNGTTLNICQTRPRSSGWVELRSADPLEAPIIRPNYLQEQYDLDVMCEGVEFGREIMSQPVIAKYLSREYAPGPVRSRAEVLAYVKSQAHAALHPMGTCKMGSDDMAVLDPELRVHGIDGLRVCDNSAGPNLVSGNTNGVAIMIAERAADFIAARHGFISGRMADARNRIGPSARP
ncbi:MAG: alanine-phosphoribitol ligase [Mesorhizobium sp.]|uniref:GMC family oxidoreductase n=1 Tax=Mesorhizobium sp. TaxID=1871066 RepID=UPI000FE85595|nr:GMC family oxidoreductase N-terminal domain-containing protein [Mesorhizobium sp.]RWC17144.1 MAG: alanine-phosphoribitol ligase [Mesorhizobium sp.]